MTKRGDGDRAADPRRLAVVRRTSAARITVPPAQRNGSGGKRLAVGVDEREPRQLVAAVEREPREDLAAEVGRPDAVPREAEAVMHAAAAAEDRQVRGGDVDRAAPGMRDPPAAQLREEAQEAVARAAAAARRVDLEPGAASAAEAHPARRPSRTRSGRPGSCAGSGAACGSRRSSSPPVQPSSSITSGTGSVMHHVARGDREREPEAGEAGGGAVDGEHGGAGAHRSGRASSRSRRRRDRRTAVRSWSRTPASMTRARRPSASRAGCTVAAVAEERTAEEDRRCAPRGDARRPRQRRTSSGAPTPRRPRSTSSQSTELRLARRDLRACGAARYQASTPRARAPRADPAGHARSEARHDLDRARVADAVAQDRQVVPERRDEAAVPPARAVARKAGLEHDDVEPGLERLQLPRRPEPEVAAADDDHVRGRVALERRASARPARPPRATSRSACAACRAPTSSFSRRRHSGASEPPGRAKGDRLSCMRAVAVAQLVEPRVVVPVVAGSSPVRHPRDYPPGTRPRSSADRAAGFEPACGGSTPPGAIVARRARRDHRRRSSARDDRPISAVTWFCGVPGSPRRWGSPSAPSASFSSSSCSGTPPAAASLPRRSGSTTR